MGFSLGLCINPAKCELFSRTVLSDFPQEMKVSQEPNFEVLGVPIGDPIFCAKFLAQRRAKCYPIWLLWAHWTPKLHSSSCVSVQGTVN